MLLVDSPPVVSLGARLTWRGGEKMAGASNITLGEGRIMTRVELY